MSAVMLHVSWTIDTTIRPNLDEAARLLVLLRDSQVAQALINADEDALINAYEDYEIKVPEAGIDAARLHPNVRFGIDNRIRDHLLTLIHGPKEDEGAVISFCDALPDLAVVTIADQSWGDPLLENEPYMWALLDLIRQTPELRRLTGVLGPCVTIPKEYLA